MAKRRRRRRLSSAGMTLNETLAQLGLVKTKLPPPRQGYRITWPNGRSVAEGSAQVVWTALRERGLIA